VGRGWHGMELAASWSLSSHLMGRGGYGMALAASWSLLDYTN